MLRSVLFSVVALAAAGAAVAHDGDRWDRGGDRGRYERYYEGRHGRHDRDERYGRYERDERRWGSREYRPAPRYSRYPDRYVYAEPAYPVYALPPLGLSIYIPLR